MDRIDRIFDRNTAIISALVSSALDYDMPISSKVYPVDPVYPVKFLFIELPFTQAPGFGSGGLWKMNRWK